MRADKSKIATLLIVAIILAQAFISNTHSQKLRADPSRLKSISSIEDLVEWMAFYYISPRPDLAGEAIKFIDRNRVIETSLDQPPIAAFFSIVFRDNASEIPKWSQLFSGLDRTVKETMWQALWISNTDGARAYFIKAQSEASPNYSNYLKHLLNTKPFDLLSMQIGYPSDLDMLWGAFSATGDESYVKRVVSVLPWHAMKEKDPDKFIIAAAANWSLLSNAKQHGIVMAVCREEKKDSYGVAKELLEKITK